MKNCTHCIHAEWRRTKIGYLHPSGEGTCKYICKIKPLPVSMYWSIRPKVKGGYINRREELKKHCIYYDKK